MLILGTRNFRFKLNPSIWYTLLKNLVLLLFVYINQKSSLETLTHLPNLFYLESFFLIIIFNNFYENNYLFNFTKYLDARNTNLHFSLYIEITEDL